MSPYFYYHVAPTPREQPRPERFDADGEDGADGAVLNTLTWGEHLAPDHCLK